jgi:hypothetical protein
MIPRTVHILYAALISGRLAYAFMLLSAMFPVPLSAPFPRTTLIIGAVLMLCMIACYAGLVFHLARPEAAPFIKYWLLGLPEAITNVWLPAIYLLRQRHPGSVTDVIIFLVSFALLTWLMGSALAAIISYRSRITELHSARNE